MDDAAQKQVQAKASDNAQIQPQPQNAVTSGAQSAVQTPVVPVGSLNKEAELAPVSDFVKPTETSPIKDSEVKDAGVTEVSQSVELSREHEQIGIKPAAEATPVKVENLKASAVELPMTEVQAADVVKKSNNIRSSIVWLAILMLKNFKKMHRKLLKKGV